MKSLIRILAVIASLPLLGLGAASMFAPTSMYAMLNLQPQGIFGINTVRSDIGGMLISSAIMIWLGFLRQNTTWFQATILVMSTLLVGRTISTIADGFTTDAIPAIVVEVYTVVVLYFAIKQFKAAD
jgi:cation transport ATPase